MPQGLHLVKFSSTWSLPCYSFMLSSHLLDLQPPYCQKQPSPCGCFFAYGEYFYLILSFEVVGLYKHFVGIKNKCFLV